MCARRRKANVSDTSNDVQDLQRWVWGRMPLRKYLCGHNKVFDVVAVLIQEWPVEAIDGSASGETAEVHALEELAMSCKRHLALVYGQEQWDLWSVTMKHIIWQALWLLLQWYRQSSQHRARLIRMRNKWRHRKG
jgi:hypothetical protein